MKGVFNAHRTFVREDQLGFKGKHHARFKEHIIKTFGDKRIFIDFDTNAMPMKETCAPAHPMKLSL